MNKRIEELGLTDAVVRKDEVAVQNVLQQSDNWIAICDLANNGAPFGWNPENAWLAALAWQEIKRRRRLVQEMNAEQKRGRIEALGKTATVKYRLEAGKIVRYKKDGNTMTRKHKRNSVT